MFTSWEPAQMVFGSQAKKGLFCRSLTVENHLLSYQEMRPLGGWRLRQLAAIGTDALRPFASSVDETLEGYRVLSVKRKNCYNGHRQMLYAIENARS
jgi:hypothetical protein